ncbi:5481_t:CDS:2 [Paraglomus brasilianum]|uniref:5481_t:CDS:1 n=1 Tax=Paraglomus brasilianum TaxID=144538 RepID=A0A9N9G4D5_9GLOM|nr:5481_t:CDS:2 [Paraglomus brasilianum]
MKPLFTSQTATPTHSANPNSNNWDLLSSSFYHTLANSLPFRLLVVGSQELNSANYYLYYLSPIYSNLKQFSITNLLLAYTLPLLYIFSPTLIVPAIFVKSLQFLASKTASISSTISLHKTSSTAFFNVSSLTNNISSASSSPRSDNGGGSDLSVQDVEYWLQRCSICFDAQLDFCLDFCRDQFCRECFQRSGFEAEGRWEYVKEVVQNSWGLSVTKIKCPVCQDVISQSEWSRYVDQSIIDLYNTYNKPYRSFSRCCGECGEEVFAASVVHAYEEEKARHFHEISYLLHQFLQTYISPTRQTQTNIHYEINQFVSRFKADYTAYLGGTSVNYGVLEMYDYIAEKLGECLGLRLDGSGGQVQSKMTRRRSKIYGDMVKAAAEISARLVALEARPDPWRQLQFLHIANFPQSRCTRCTADLCLQCGESSHHVGMSCTQFMRHRVSNSSLFLSSTPHTTPNNSPDALENIKWKLANSKSYFVGFVGMDGVKSVDFISVVWGER